MKKLERKEKEKQFKQGIILDAAKELFKTKGYSDTTMSDIAAEAGFAKGTLYLYYKSKSEIILNLSLELKRDFSEKIDKVISKDLNSSTKFSEIVDIFKYIVLVELDDLGIYDFVSEFSIKDLQTSDFGEEFLEYECSIVKAFEGIISQAQKEKAIDTTINGKDLAIFLDTLFEGIINKLAFLKQNNFKTGLKYSTYGNISKEEYVDKIFNLLESMFKNKGNN